MTLPWWLLVLAACSISAACIASFLLRVGSQYDSEMDMGAEERE